MKRILLCIAIFCIILSTTAQVTQVGVVKEYNSNGKPVPGVGISILSSTDLQPTAFNSDGFFRLNFSKKGAGDMVYNLRIAKTDTKSSMPRILSTAGHYRRMTL